MKLEITDYITVNKTNALKINARLKSHGGAVLIVEAGSRSFPDHIIDAKLFLFQNCRLEDESVQVSWGDDWVQNRNKQMMVKRDQDREYQLRKKDPPSKDPLWEYLANTKERLILTKDYGFEINPASVVSRGYLDEGSTTFYIPGKNGIQSCFTVAITSMINLINKQARKDKEPPPLTDGHVSQIIEYMLDDLVTGIAMRKNYEHGLMADAALGMG